MLDLFGQYSEVQKQEGRQKGSIEYKPVAFLPCHSAAQVLFVHIHSLMIPAYDTQIPEMEMQGEWEPQMFGGQGQKIRTEN